MYYIVCTIKSMMMVDWPEIGGNIIVRNFKSDTLYTMVYQEIREYIVSNHLQVGDKLPPELELSQTLGVSRNVVREALKALQLMGILKPVPSKGYVISAFSFDGIYENIVFHLLPTDVNLRKEMDTIRGAMEQFFLDEAIDKVNPQTLQQMQSALLGMRQCLKTGKRIFEFDRTFHTALYQSIENQMFHSLERVTWDLHPRTVITDENNQEYMEQTWERHKNFYDAVAAGDKESAHHWLSEHMNHSFDYTFSGKEKGLTPEKAVLENISNGE